MDDGGFDRVVVRDNRVRVTMPNGIALFGVRNGDVRGNSVSTVPGSMQPNRPGRPVRAGLRIVDSPSLTVCGNILEDRPLRGKAGDDRC